MIYNRIKALCNEKNMLIKDLAEKLDISPTTISRWNSGSSPNAAQLVKLSVFFDVSIDYLLGRTDDSEISQDERMIVLQRNYLKMTERQKEQMLMISKMAIEDAFNEENEDETI